MSSEFFINVNMDSTTVETLSKAGFMLYGFKAVQTTMEDGFPTVWFSASNYSQQTVISWSEQFQAYTSLQTVSNDVTITASFSAPIDLGQTMTVLDQTGIGTVSDGGDPSSISINNMSQTQFACGLLQSSSESTGANPICTFPLFGMTEDVITPIQKILLTFSTDAINTGAVQEFAIADGFLIDLTDAPANTRTVTFQINTGWSNGNAPWGMQVVNLQNLIPLLIDSSSSNTKKRRASAK